MHRSPSRRVRLVQLPLLFSLLLAGVSVLTGVLALSIVGLDAGGSDSPAAASEVEREDITVFMCAGSSDLYGAHELGGLIEAMKERQALSLKHCQTAYLGYIHHADGHAVRSLVVSTGINYISSSLCTRSVLKLRRELGYVYSAMVFVGTSSFSPMLGGWDPTNTSAYNAFKASEQEVRIRQATVDDGQIAPPTASQLNFEFARTGEQVDWDGCSPRIPSAITPLSLGSVCVTSTAYLIETGSCTERVRHTQCSRPHCTILRNELDSETKVFFTDDAFAQKIRAASHGKKWPEMPEMVKNGQRRFWATNEAVEAVDEGGEHYRVTLSGPSLVTCAEATGNTVSIGAERDYLCREHTSHALNLAQHLLAERHQREADPKDSPLTTQNVACVRAMESMGFLRSLVNGKAARDIPVAVVRGASSYDMLPMKKVYVPPAVWRSALATGQLTVSPRVAAALEAEELAAVDGEGIQQESGITAYTWHQSPHFMPQAEYQAFVTASVHYAVETATFVLSNYFFGGRYFSSANSTP